MVKTSICVLSCLATPAFASSEEAWTAFCEQVETTCAALVQLPAGATLDIEVNPFGSESFGVALMSVNLADGTVERSACIVDKQTLQAEKTGPFTATD